MRLFQNTWKHTLKLPSRDPNHWRKILCTVTIPHKLEPQVGQGERDPAINATLQIHSRDKTNYPPEWTHTQTSICGYMPINWSGICHAVWLQCFLCMENRETILPPNTRPCVFGVQKENVDINKPTNGPLSWLCLLQNLFLSFGTYPTKWKGWILRLDTTPARGLLDPWFVCIKAPWFKWYFKLQTIFVI